MYKSPSTLSEKARGAIAETLNSRLADGLDLTADVYPYTAGSTLLAALLPPWVLDGGPGPALERLRDRSARERVKQDYERGLPGWQNLVEMAGWENLVIAGDPPYAGRSLAGIGADSGRHPFDAMADVILERPGSVVILHMPQVFGLAARSCLSQAICAEPASWAISEFRE